MKRSPGSRRRGGTATRDELLAEIKRLKRELRKAKCAAVVYRTEPVLTVHEASAINEIKVTLSRLYEHLVQLETVVRARLDEASGRRR